MPNVPIPGMQSAELFKVSVKEFLKKNVCKKSEDKTRSTVLLPPQRQQLAVIGERIKDFYSSNHRNMKIYSETEVKLCAEIRPILISDVSPSYLQALAVLALTQSSRGLLNQTGVKHVATERKNLIDHRLTVGNLSF